jgi:hypothetical protein
VRRLARGALPFAVLALTSCLRLPFVNNKPGPSYAPTVVDRFAAQARALGAAPGGASLPEVLGTLADAVESLPGVTRAPELAARIRVQAKATEGLGAGAAAARTRPALAAAMEALDATRSTAKKSERERALAAARAKVAASSDGSPAAVAAALDELARAMIVLTSGRPAPEFDASLGALVRRMATEEPDEARRTGAIVILALSRELRALPQPPRKVQGLARGLDKRADRVSTAEPLDYAERLREALEAAVSALAAAPLSPAAARLLDEARRSVAAIRPDRPFELQRAVVQDGLRCLADAMALAAAPATGGAIRSPSPGAAAAGR